MCNEIPLQLHYTITNKTVQSYSIIDIFHLVVLR
jgi:hypothetical protein